MQEGRKLNPGVLRQELSSCRNLVLSIERPEQGPRKIPSVPTGGVRKAEQCISDNVKNRSPHVFVTVHVVCDVLLGAAFITIKRRSCKASR